MTFLQARGNKDKGRLMDGLQGKPVTKPGITPSLQWRSDNNIAYFTTVKKRRANYILAGAQQISSNFERGQTPTTPLQQLGAARSDWLLSNRSGGTARQISVTSKDNGKDTGRADKVGQTPPCVTVPQRWDGRSYRRVRVCVCVCVLQAGRMFPGTPDRTLDTPLIRPQVV